MGIYEGHVMEEMANIEDNAPLDPGSSISHKTLHECERRLWACRDGNGCVVPTAIGILSLMAWLDDDAREEKG